MRQHYPVETKWAFSNKRKHLARDATAIVDQLTLTYGSGELCSAMTYETASVGGFQANTRI